MTDQATFEIESHATQPTAWDHWIDRVEKLMQLTQPEWTPDGDQEADVYSLDWLTEQHRKGKSPLKTSEGILWRMHGLHKSWNNAAA